MAAYTFGPTVVVDPLSDGQPMANAIGSVYDPADEAFNTPLTVTDSTGATVTAVASNSKGILMFGADLVRVMWKSGSTPPIELLSGQGLVDKVDTAAASASAAQAAAEQAAADAQAPTDTAVTNVITTSLADPSTPIAQAVNSSAEATASGVVDSIKPDGGVKAVGKGELRTVDTDYSSLEAALAATADGGTLEVRNVWARTTPWTINKSVTVAFARGGQVTVASGSTDAIRVTVSDVTLQRPYASGAGSATAGAGCGISAIGTALAPITGLTIERPHVDSYDKYGIYLENVTDFTIDRPAISSIAYAGIMMISCIRGGVRGGAVRTITQPSGFTNSYGIAMSRDSSKNITDSPRSQSITVDGTLVSGVPLWEGIDTHGGTDLTIANVQVQNCNVGIALVASPSGGVDTYAPQRCKIIGGTIDSGVSDGSRSNGIQIVGAGSTVGTPVEAASGCVVLGTTIIGHGNQGVSTSAAGAIITYFTSACLIANVTIVRPGFCGIQAYHTNAALTVLGSSVEDAWSNAQAFTAILYIRSNYNSVNVGSMRVLRGSVTATQVNTRGLHVASSTTNNTVNDMAGNEWANCTLPSSGATNTMKASFYGAVPVTKPAVSGAKGSNAALASLISQLVALGLVTDTTTA